MHANKILFQTLICFSLAACCTSRNVDSSHTICATNQLYESIMTAYSASNEQAARTWEAASQDASSEIINYILECKGVGIGGAWEEKSQLTITKRLNSRGYIDWKFKINKDLSPHEHEFIEWILLTRTNIEPTEFLYYKHGTTRPNVGNR